MADDRPFTKDDAAALSTNLEKLFDAKLDTLNERLTGIRNWGMAAFGALTLLAGSTFATHAPPAQQAKTAVMVLTRIF